MIYTLTMNPSVDFNYYINEDVSYGNIYIPKEVAFHAGGKGINVSMVLKSLGIKSIAMGIIAGFTGDMIEEEFYQKNMPCDFLRLASGNTRICFNICALGEMKFNPKGPEIREEDVNNIKAKLSRLNRDDILILSGSLPKGCSEIIYSEIMKELNSKGIKFIVDAIGNTLISAAREKPFLVKPNINELFEAFCAPVNYEERQVELYARKLKDIGAKNVLVSMGEKGAMLLTEDDKTYVCAAPVVNAVNTVGAGDAMVAGFVYGCSVLNSYSQALCMSVACGTANVVKKGVLIKETVIKYYNLLNENKIYLKEI